MRCGKIVLIFSVNYLSLLSMKKEYGQVIPRLMINGEPAPYPVVNERSVRVAAGMC